MHVRFAKQFTHYNYDPVSRSREQQKNVLSSEKG